MERLWIHTEKEQQRYSEKSCSSATLPTTDLTCTGQKWNPNLFGKKPVKNSLNYGTTVSLVSIDN